MNYDNILDSIPELQEGAHAEGTGALCAMEAIAWLAGEEHTDEPKCACPVIGAYVRRGNDTMGDKRRQRLAGYLLRILDTRSPEHELERAKVIAMHAVNVIVPMVSEGYVSDSLLNAMRTAATLDTAADAARDAYRAIYRAASDAAAAATAITASASASAAAAATAITASASVAASDADDADAAAAAAAVHAASAAVHADADKVWDAYFDGLDMMLAIGPQRQAQPRVSTPFGAEVTV